MIRKALLFIIILIIINVTVNAQTQQRPSKQETENWIISKLSKYVINLESPYCIDSDLGGHIFYSAEGVTDVNSLGGYKDLSIFIQDGNIIFNYNVNYWIYQNPRTISKNSPGYTAKGSYKVIIPIYDVVINEGILGSRGITSSLRSIRKISTNLIRLSDSGNQVDESENILDNNFNINVEFDKEDNLKDRMIKAFQTLQYYYPKPKNNEAF